MSLRNYIKINWGAQNLARDHFETSDIDIGDNNTVSSDTAGRDTFNHNDIGSLFV